MSAMATPNKYGWFERDQCLVFRRESQDGHFEAQLVQTANGWHWGLDWAYSGIWARVQVPCKENVHRPTRTEAVACIACWDVPARIKPLKDKAVRDALGHGQGDLFSKWEAVHA